MPILENKFNDLGPKEWLPFQKSFTQFKDMESLVESNLRFFTKPSLEPRQNVAGFGSNEFKSLIKTKSLSLKLEYDSTLDPVDFLAVDLTDNETSISDAIEWILKKGKNLNYRKFLWVIIPDELLDETGIPFVWSLSNQLAGYLTRKDEKIICHPDGTTWTSLYFRNDEYSNLQKPSIKQSTNQPIPHSTNQIKNWFILKPKPRSKDEILHPAKYPEDLVEMYVNEFTKKGDTVFDPMSGTGTTQITSLQLERNTFGIELSELFHGIASKRCSDLNSKSNWEIFQGDARDILNFEIPKIDYVITSPPYWDMLNMKGAEVQASRKAKGLQTNYSDNKNDLGNLDDYSNFLAVLIDIYKKTAEKLKKDGHITIVVKNVKKKGNHYPLAFDITEKLNNFLKFKHVGFWCQDDLQIAPYGYKHTWVSNTFHHYCLTFQKA